MEEKLKEERLKKERRNRLIELRKKYKLSQHEVASAAGISMSSYNALERGGGERHFTEKIFDKIAKVLKTTPNYIMFGFEQRNAFQELVNKESLEKDPESLEILVIRNNLIKLIFEIDDVSILRIVKSIFEVDDVATLRKIGVFVDDQKEYATLKRQASQSGGKDSAEEEISRPTEEKSEKVLETEGTEDTAGDGGDSSSAENAKPHEKRKEKTKN